MRCRLALLPLVLALGCSSADFTVAPGSGVGDGGTNETLEPMPDTGTMDLDVGPSPDGGALDAIPAMDSSAGTEVGLAESGVVCPAASDPTDVYVDLKAVAVPTGSMSCPFKSITAALTYVATLGPKKRIIHVNGGTPDAPYVYVEPGTVGIRPDLTLVGAGSRAVTIQGGGACGSAGNCAVFVDAGAVLEGVTVNAIGTRHAIVTGSAAGYPSPILRNLRATGAAGDGAYGVLVMGGALLGPSIEVSGNERSGVMMRGGSVLRVIDGPNRFDANGEDGITLEAGILQFEGGQASNNSQSGIRFASGSLALHSVQRLTAMNNNAAGISANPTASLVLRASTLLKNPFGLRFTFGTSNLLDLGRDGVPGANTFGTASSTTQNKFAGICLQMIRSGGTPPAEGNRWSTCTSASPSVVPAASTLQLFDGCESASSYRDIYFRNASGGNALSPVQTFGCTVAP